MSPVVRVMSRSPWMWRLWMTAGTPLLLASFVLNVLIEAVVHAYQQWHWEWKYEFREWFSKFGERHRKSLHSLGLKPEPGGTLVTRDRIDDQVWLFEDRGPGREFTHVRNAEDVH